MSTECGPSRVRSEWLGPIPTMLSAFRLSSLATGLDHPGALGSPRRSRFLSRLMRARSGSTGYNVPVIPEDHLSRVPFRLARFRWSAPIPEHDSNLRSSIGPTGIVLVVWGGDAGPWRKKFVVLQDRRHSPGSPSSTSTGWLDSRSCHRFPERICTSPWFPRVMIRGCGRWPASRTTPHRACRSSCRSKRGLGPWRSRASSRDPDSARLMFGMSSNPKRRPASSRT